MRIVSSKEMAISHFAFRYKLKQSRSIASEIPDSSLVRKSSLWHMLRVDQGNPDPLSGELGVTTVESPKTLA